LVPIKNCQRCARQLKNAQLLELTWKIIMLNLTMDIYA
jgi:hypothetical protein